MPKAMLFWVIYILAVVFWLIGAWPAGPVGYTFYVGVGGNLLLFVLVGILGWGLFGKPIT